MVNVLFLSGISFLFAFIHLQDWRLHISKPALTALQSSTSQGKNSKNAVWLILGMLPQWQERRNTNKKTKRRKKNNERLEMEKSLHLQISHLDRRIRFIISCIQFLINFMYFDISYNIFVVTKLTCLSVLWYESVFVFFSFMS